MKKRLSSAAAFSSLLLLSGGPLHADDWPHWLGPQSDSVWRETGLVKTFPDKGPAVKWKVPVGWGYSGPAVSGGRVVVADYVIREGKPDANPGGRTAIKGDERVRCFDSATGKEIWTHTYDAPLNLSFPAGPRCTPCVDDGMIYAVGAEGHVSCLALADGKPAWELDLKKNYGVESPIWGFSSHPVVKGNLVYLRPGGEGTAVVALDKKTGKEVWRALTAKEVGYAPPAVIHHGGRDQLIVAHGEAICSLDPETGKVFWTVPFVPNYGMAIMAPRLSGDFLVMGGMVKKSIGLKLKADLSTPEIAWEGTPKTGIAPKNATPVVDDGLLFGCDADGELRCIDPATGERLWSSEEVLGSTPNSGTFFMVKASPHWVIFNELGELILADLTRKGYKETARAMLLDPTSPGMGRKVIWSHPAFAEKSVFARNDKVLVRVSLAAEAAEPAAEKEQQQEDPKSAKEPEESKN
ncbi:MAG: PQQ-binding-like beta-propeller repeat protein [Verrucomicrobiota bacterium]